MLKLENVREYSPIFKTARVAKRDLKDNKHDSLYLARKYARIFALGIRSLVLGHYLFPAKFTVFPELRSRKTVRFSEQMMSRTNIRTYFVPMFP